MSAQAAARWRSPDWFARASRRVAEGVRTPRPRLRAPSNAHPGRMLGRRPGRCRVGVPTVSTVTRSTLADCRSMADDLRPLLRRLLAPPGPSGFEAPAAAAFREAARPFAAEVHGDALGTSYAVVNPGGRPRVALVAHLDEIGFLVSHVDAQGMLWLSEVG